VRHRLGASNTFRLYVHQYDGKFIGLCAELREVIEGASADEIDTVLEVDHVINATGPGYGPRALLAMPLTRCLLESGLADVHPNGGLTVAPDNF
jgi:hypothetical protein